MKHFPVRPPDLKDASESKFNFCEFEAQESCLATAIFRPENRLERNFATSGNLNIRRSIRITIKLRPVEPREDDLIAVTASKQSGRSGPFA